MANMAVYTLTEEQSAQLQERLSGGSWELSVIPHARFKAVADKVSVVSYQSGKLVVQGKGTEDFVEFILEPEILHTYNTLKTPEPAVSDADASPHGGIDESGKGDFFGPLSIAGVSVTPETAVELRKAGACDSKTISSSKKIFLIADEIKRIARGRYTVVMLKPAVYNRLYNDIGNLNRLLAWGHARVIENLLELDPDCPRMLSDKFGNEILIRRALMERGRRIQLDQQTKAESDVAVAAASILAREAFLKGMAELNRELGVELPRGGGPNVKVIGRQLLEKHGPQIFESCAKCHFKTRAELLAEKE